MSDWTIDWDTEAKEIDTGNNDVNGERMKYMRLGTMKITVPMNDVQDLRMSVHVNDNDSLYGLAQKVKALGARLELAANRPLKARLKPLAHKINKDQPLDEKENQTLKDVIASIREIIA